MSTIGELEKAGSDYIAGMTATVRQLWLAMCQEDGIEPTAQFVAFSETNRFVPFYAQAMTQLWEAKAAYRPGGGYVGLRIRDGKAVTK